MNSRVYLETFSDYDDAEYWLETTLKEKAPEETIQEASLRYINGHWIAGVMFQKGQMEFDYGF